MKVLHILNELRHSGAEVMLKIAAPYWQESSLALHILSTGVQKGRYADKLGESGYVIHHLPFQNSPVFYYRLYNLLKEQEINIVHIHSEHASLTYAIIAKLAGCQVIRTIHSNFLFTGTTKITRTIRRWLIRIIGVKQVSISTAVRDNEQNRFKNPTQLIYNWYDDAHFIPPTLSERILIRKKFGISSKAKVIVSIGNCAPVKNHAAILHAMKSLKESGLCIHYLHVGEENETQTERKLVEELGIEAQVFFCGSNEDVRPFLWAADFFVMPSLHEGFGIAMFEAMATGICVILAKSPGLIEWSILFPNLVYVNPIPNDIVAILKNLAIPNNKNRKNLYRLLKEKFGTSRGAREYQNLYFGSK